MTSGIEAASRKKMQLYKDTLKPNATDECINKFKPYRNVYNRLKRSAQIQYCKEKTEQYKTYKKTVATYEQNYQQMQEHWQYNTLYYSRWNTD